MSLEQVSIGDAYRDDCRDRDDMRTGGPATDGEITAIGTSDGPGMPAVNAKLVFVLLRGGFDGLAALVPIGDRDYESLRGRMAYEAADLIALNDGFALAPGLSPLADFWASMARAHRTHRAHRLEQVVSMHVRLVESFDH